jgi:hypothetical protein
MAAKFAKAPTPPKAKPKKRKQSKAGKKLVAKGQK